MKATYSREIITVDNAGCSKIYCTDVYNTAYCLSKLVLPTRLKIQDDEFEFYKFQDYVLHILKQQKSIRAVCQKFNAICKALEL